MKKAIITFGVGYEYDDIKYFIHSCYLHTPDADVYVFVGKNIRRLQAACAAYPRVHLVRYQQNLVARIISKFLKRFSSVNEFYALALKKIYRRKAIPVGWVNTFATPLVQFMVKRFFIIQQLLDTLPHDQIMLTDIRDVLLQADPFQLVKDNTIITGIEPVINSNSLLNSKWIRETYSDDQLRVLGREHVVCAGVTIGSRKAIQQYVNEMIEDVYANLEKIIGMLGADQAIHIRLFYQQLEGLEKHLEANGKGLIATLHFSGLNEFVLNDGKVCNTGGGELAVIHQYDRHAKLAEYLRRSLEETMKDVPLIAA